jgi:hypothetical protein
VQLFGVWLETAFDYIADLIEYLIKRRAEGDVSSRVFVIVYLVESQLVKTAIFIAAFTFL